MSKTLIILGAAALAVSCLNAGFSAAAWAESPSRAAVAPLLGDVSREFDPPAEDWLPGHRGVDIVGRPADSVVAAMDGVVSFCGSVAGKPVVTLSHGDLSTTYEPVSCLTKLGAQVSASQPIGSLEPGHPGCPEEACLHWGLRLGEEYLDPLSLLGQGRVRLIAEADMAQMRLREAAQPVYGLTGLPSSAGLISPVTAPVSSAFGLRLHPIERVWRFHDGLDLAAGCGTPIRAAAAGVVASTTYSTAFGFQLIVDHGPLAGSPMQTGYAHAQTFSVGVGEEVSQGQVIGHVGATGQATGCHLHFQVWLDGRPTDPARLLS